MKRRSERMHKVFLLADADEKQHCRAMGTSQRNLDDELDRLGELKSYRESYARQCREGGYGSMLWKDYQNFLNRLDQAVAIQTQVVMDGKMKRDAHRSRWMTKRRKAESLERAVDRFRRQDIQREGRTEQKSADELGAGHDLFRDA